MTRVKVPTGTKCFHLHGNLSRPAVLTVVDLAANWEQHRAEVTFDCATNGPQRHVFEGPLLRDVVTSAGPAFESRQRKERSRYVLAVHGGDGHGTMLSWAEIDPDFGNAPVLLATALDGRPLDDHGTQLVVPTDRCGARYVSAVTGVWLGRCEPPLPSAF
ncbi:molybdopterin-dependent oxidoreductase [Embleya hyalina]|uniref:Molybdopterin-binding oxidoreductase n=1 Tax=Embleya hyalina TaxID=516124 RepID=A0A401YF45_9ACTN|nr:molybdopterin-dependent oxidoreductase [Embleya hyalina]GCD93210.1 molybdopterin-binding oxidoreductase [Embleya hyalina]